MAYFNPFIDEEGVHIPSYAEILEYLIDRYKEIFGEDVYLDESSPDYQLLSVFSRCMDDVGALCLDAYNARNPFWATGNALDVLLPLAGMVRRGATYSTAVLKLTGAANVTVPAGSCAVDENGHIWALDDDVILSAQGIGTGSATCRTAGAITAGAGTISGIYTPLIYWMTVTNEADAVPGKNVETDEEVRVRLALSYAKSANGTASALLGRLIDIDGVESADVLENNTGTTDANGIPGHSICALVQGGEDSEIADAIIKGKAPGVGTYGNSSAAATLLGHSYTVYFSRPEEATVEVAISLYAFPGYDATRMSPIIKDAVAANINSLGIGESWAVSTGIKAIYDALAGEVPTFAIQSMTGVNADDESSTPTSGVLGCDFDQIFKTDSSHITITLV